jgi:hypothetical protein
MLTMLFVEIRKLKGSLVVLLCLVAPTLVAILLGVICVRQPRLNWHDAVQGGTGLWAYFVMPLTVTALGILLAQIEHIPRAWDHILALPIPRWRLFAAKGIVIMLLIGLMSVLLGLEIRLVGALVQAWIPKKVPAGDFPWALEADFLGCMWGASLFMAMIQLWVALCFRSFVAPLVLGLSGTFFAVAAFGAKETVYMPWVMPVSIVAGDPARATLALQLGLGGGILTCLMMMLHLSRRDA